MRPSIMSTLYSVFFSSEQQISCNAIRGFPFRSMLFKAHIEQGGRHGETIGQRSPQANG